MCLASILSKLSKDEALSEEDWNDVVSLLIIAASWLYDHSRVERTPETTQVHFQPKHSKKKKKTKE